VGTRGIEIRKGWIESTSYSYHPYSCLEFYDGEEDMVTGEREGDEHDLQTLRITMFSDTFALDLKERISNMDNEFLDRFRK
jgi:hypothetical protein